MISMTKMCSWTLIIIILIYMIQKIARPIRVLSFRGGQRYFYNEANAYIPIRPLKEGQNVLFTIGPPTKLPIIAPLLAYTPLICFGLEGFTSQWTPLVIGGTVASLFLALKLTLYADFMRSHEVFSMSVNKNLSKFWFTIPNTKFSRVWQQNWWKVSGINPQQYLLKQYRDGELDLKPSDLAFIKALQQKWKRKPSMNKAVEKHRRSLIIELDRSQIVSFERRSIKEINDLIVKTKKSQWTKKKFDVLENYTTDPQQRDFLLIKTGSIGGQPLLLYLNLKQNRSNVYEEYINALADGKTIISIV